MRWLPPVSAAILLIAAAPGLAAEPRQPTGKWVVNFADSQCIASRDYGTAESPLVLALKAPPIGSVMQVAVLRPGSGGQAEQVNAELAFDDRKPLKTTMLAYTSKEERQRAFITNLPQQSFAGIRNAKSISIRGKNQLNEQFSLGQIEALLKLMDECVADLRMVWNVSEPGAGQPKLKQPARGNLQGLIRSGDYPRVAVRDNLQGTVAFALLIDETGKVADCTVIESSGVALLDAQSCALMKIRAKFTPAVGLDGRPAKHSFIQRLNWRME